ncbi:MAG: hypothetical protein HOW73_43870 [Polyangiaceae bacterium]|nr:hypothetical protein [Polyangiaceae bacterium]
MTKSVNATLAMLMVTAAACGGSPIGGGPEDPPIDPPDTEPEVVPPVDKVDLLLVVDNSMSMADKQAILAPSVRRLITNLVNPPCADANGPLPTEDQPAGPYDACPAGSTRVSEPLDDLRIGIISSSLGDLGSGACGSVENANDWGHLVTRTLDGSTVPTYQDHGFLVWDPAAQQSPPGETDLETLIQHAESLIVGVNDIGCGYEMPLEATYRFLADPAPYTELAMDSQGVLQPIGVDTYVLSQRSAFMRPDSFLGIVLLSDENDCSIDVASPGHFFISSSDVYRPTSACATDPDDACCTSCALPTPAGCAPDPVCDDPMGFAPQNLRCWDPKQQFGVDFKYPAARYINALSAPTIDPSQSDLAASSGAGVANPIFASGRHLQHVSLTAIVGVPWQDLVTDPTNPASPRKTTSQMETDGSWAWVTGRNSVDPLMRESIDPRGGNNPATGEPVNGANSINGGDRPSTGSLDPGIDLQYTCIFGLEEPIANGGDCDCGGVDCDSPICDGSTQVAAKAYPGKRQLEVIRGLGDRGIAGSICPPVTNAQDPGGPLTYSAIADENYNQSMFALEYQVRAQME